LLGWLASYGWPSGYSSTVTLGEHQMVSSDELDRIRSDFTGTKETLSSVPRIKPVRLPQSWSFIAAKFLTDPVWFFHLFWFPDYFKKTRHLDIKSSWPHLMTVYYLVTVISRRPILLKLLQIQVEVVEIDLAIVFLREDEGEVLDLVNSIF
jgi:ACS family hexuronate transporter-like MFS transporter